MLTDLVKIRREKAETQESVARKARISRAAYTNIENGKRRPSPKVAQRIASVLGFPWTWFFEEERKEDGTA